MKKLCFAAALLATALPLAAWSATISVGGQNALAHACYVAAEHGPSISQRQALATCDRSLQEEALLVRDRMATHVNRGVINFRSRNLHAALLDFDRALALQPNQPDALINKALTMTAGDGDINEAIKLFDTALAGKPERPWIGYYGRAVAHELSMHDALAYYDYRRAQALRPDWTLPSAALTRFTVKPKGS